MVLCTGQLITASTQAIAQEQQATTLEPSVPIEREIGPGQKHLYQLTLRPGQFIKIEVKQLGAEVRMSLLRPDGKTIPVLDSFMHEPLVHFERVVDLAGTYRVQLFTRSKAPTGRYEIRLSELRPATEKDRALEEAQELVEKVMVLTRNDKFEEAVPLWTRVIEIREKALGPESLEVAEALGSLGIVYEHLSDYANSELLLQREMRIKEKIHGPDHPAVADVLRELADLSISKGDYVQAEAMLLKARGILEQKQGETINFAALLQRLGDVYYARNDYAQSANYFRRSVAILERLLGPEHFHLVDAFTMLGHVAYDAGDYPQAETSFQKAVTIAEKALGPQHLQVAGRLDDLAMLYSTTGQYQTAEELYRRALKIREQRGMTDEQAQETPSGLARLYAARGQLSEAVKFQTRSSDIEERFLSLNLAMGSEREKLALLENLSWGSSRNVSFHTNLSPNDPQALELAVNTILRRKGRVLDSLSTALAALRLRLGPEDQKVLDQLNETNGRLANLVLTGPQKASALEYQEQIKRLEEERDSLEAEISRRTAGFYQRSQGVTVSAIQRLIPAHAALIEFAVYRPFDPRAPDNRTAFGEPRYVAYVIRPAAPVQWKELGPEKAVDSLVDALRQALRDPHHTEVQKRARALDEKIMQPLRAAAGDATQLLISPDGELNLIPFAALSDEDGRYLIERYSLVYLTSGRDLLRMQVERTSKSGPLLIANPLFGEPPAELAANTNRGHRSTPGGARRSVLTGNDLTETYFAPLSGTAQEAISIRKVFPDAALLSGAQATESALKQVMAPGILHIATHGFFLQNDHSSEGAEPIAGTRGINRQTKIENPLLRSGLALSGANLHRAGTDDGILTALEASGLNLWGTKLVVLSACDTGVGEVRNQEGVYGLRRAFVLGGAESLLMSLWPVSDYTTRNVMMNYYQNLKRGMGRGEALREVQLEMLKRNPKMHPFYWANFIESGDWTPLAR